MTVTIRPDDEQLIAKVIRTGAYQNADEVIARALEVLRSDEEWLDEARSAIGERIDRAFEQFDRGQFFSAEASKSDMEARKAAWLRNEMRGQQA
jgi:putative addiction module CopG family antidote